MSQSGDAPVQMEVMNGQQIDPKTELMGILEQMAVNATDVPYEVIQLRQSVEYATQLSMSSSKFLRKVFKRQAICERKFGRLINTIYNYEYGTDDTINLTLPPPGYINSNNTNQMLSNTNELVANIIEIECSDEQDEVFKAEFRRNLTRHYLSTYLDYNSIDEIKSISKMKAETKRNNNEQ